MSKGRKPRCHDPIPPLHLVLRSWLDVQHRLFTASSRLSAARLINRILHWRGTTGYPRKPQTHALYRLAAAATPSTACGRATYSRPQAQSMHNPSTALLLVVLVVVAELDLAVTPHAPGHHTLVPALEKDPPTVKPYTHPSQLPTHLAHTHARDATYR